MPIGDTTIHHGEPVAADPELRYTLSGHVVFTVAASRRVYDQDSGQWARGVPLPGTDVLGDRARPLL